MIRTLPKEKMDALRTVLARMPANQLNDLLNYIKGLLQVAERTK